MGEAKGCERAGPSCKYGQKNFIQKVEGRKRSELFASVSTFLL